MIKSSAHVRPGHPGSVHLGLGMVLRIVAITLIKDSILTTVLFLVIIFVVFVFIVAGLITTIITTIVSIVLAISPVLVESLLLAAVLLLRRIA